MSGRASKPYHINLVLYRSYGVLLWEIANYGTVPLESFKAQEIVDMAQQHTLDHPWSVLNKLIILLAATNIVVKL